jgi:tetratricopeptide (TPR) repeat protein
MPYKGAGKSLTQIARELGVDGVIEGSVLHDGDQVRIAVQLIQGATDRHLWSDSYQRELRGILGLQSDVARAVAREIRVTLTSQDQQRLANPDNVDRDAYEAYLRGLQYADQQTDDGQKKSIELLEQAVRLDPQFASAHARLAMSYATFYMGGGLQPREFYPKARDAALSALAIDDTLSEAHTALAYQTLYYEWNWPESERQIRRAIELNPNSLDAYHCYAMYFLGPLGRMEEALATEDLVLAKDPLALGTLFIRALILECLGREEVETQSIERLNQLDPNFVFGQLLLVRLRARQRRFDEAIALADRMVEFGRWGMTLGALGIAHASAGHEEIAREVIAELEASPLCKESRAFYTALIVAALGDKSAAFAWAARSIDRRDHLMPLFLRGASFERLRTEESYAELLRSMNIA